MKPNNISKTALPGPRERRSFGVTPDRTDRAILEALQKDAGLSNKELARKVRLAPSSCLQRVRRLRSSGTIRGLHADVSPPALGVGLQAIVAVRLTHHLEKEVEAFRERLRSHPEVINVYHVSGGVDFFVHVAVRDVAHLRTVGIEAFTSHRLVSHVETSIIFDHERSKALPDLLP
jgi:DNA-binding Lrp family transcriptional regulator